MVDAMDCVAVGRVIVTYLALIQYNAVTMIVVMGIHVHVLVAAPVFHNRVLR